MWFLSYLAKHRTIFSGLVLLSEWIVLFHWVKTVDIFVWNNYFMLFGKIMPDFRINLFFVLIYYHNSCNKYSFTQCLKCTLFLILYQSQEFNIQCHILLILTSVKRKDAFTPFTLTCLMKPFQHLSEFHHPTFSRW